MVTFLPAVAAPRVPLPLAHEDAQVLWQRDREVFSAYVPRDDLGPRLMRLIEKAFGRDVTTRTWDTVRRCAEG